MDQFRDVTASHRYELVTDGGTVFADYRREGGTVYINHVEAPPELRGTGAAGRFMQAMLEHIRASGLRAVPVCSYAVAWMQRHPEFNDIMAKAED